MISKTLAQLASQQEWMLWTTCLGLLIFLTFFVGMLFWISRPERASIYERMSQMPLGEVEK